MSNLLLIPLEDIVVFPNMNVTLTVDVGDEERVLLVPKHEGEFAKVGTVAEVGDHVRLPARGRAHGPPPGRRRRGPDGPPRRAPRGCGGAPGRGAGRRPHPRPRAR